MGLELGNLRLLGIGKTISDSRPVGRLDGHRATGQVGEYPGGNVNTNDALHGLFEGVQSAAGVHQADDEHQVEPDEEPLRPATTRLVNGFLRHATGRYQRPLLPQGAP